MGEKAVRIRAGARIQLGFFPYGEGYVGLGLGVTEPAVEVCAYARPGPLGDEDAALAVRRLQAAGWIVRGTVTMGRRIPRHVGLGSGTALALSVAEALCLVHGVSAKIPDLHLVVRPNARTWVGRTIYEQGGLVFSEPGIARRVPWPSTWGLVTVYPKRLNPAWQVSGALEQNALTRLRRRVSRALEQQWRQQLTRAWEKGAIPGDLTTWRTLFYELQQDMSNVYRSIAGVPGLDPRTARVLQWWEQALGIKGTQSSWGPLVYAMGACNEVAEWQRLTARHFGEDMVVSLAAPADHGRVIDIKRGEPIAYPGGHRH